MSGELLQIRVNEASKCSKMDILNFQSVVTKNCTKLETNSSHNLKANMKYYVLTQYASNDCTSIVKQILHLAAATYGADFTTKALFLKQIFVVSRLIGRIVSSMLK